MKATIGDWLVVKSATTGKSEQRGLVLETHGADGSPPFLVRWLDSGHEALMYPGPDAVVLTAEEIREADERAEARAMAVQDVIRQHPH
ncbi:DUF1918 domain-containing protein [Mycolicibacterium palauense]|uniref:DUF1918 domain-containing protein n=1 Tax=Mycolicibacterium palauense TaxID=2034511 RepID=UPI000BFEBB2F|nr:DUF1918 domain-containing protein [Mycolicibacterium palauense]